MNGHETPHIPTPEEEYKKNPAFTDEQNLKMEESEIMGGVKLENISVGKTLSIQTQNTKYLLEHREDGWYISGHPRHCPNPTLINYIGSTWGGNMMKLNYVGRGMRLEYALPKENNQDGEIPTTNITSTIKEVEEV